MKEGQKWETTVITGGKLSYVVSCIVGSGRSGKCACTSVCRKGKHKRFCNNRLSIYEEGSCIVCVMAAMWERAEDKYTMIDCTYDQEPVSGSESYEMSNIVAIKDLVHVLIVFRAFRRSELDRSPRHH